MHPGTCALKLTLHCLYGVCTWRILKHNCFVIYCVSLRVLARLMTNRFLHRQIREKGGAYGAGARYGSGIFSFYSYRYVHMTVFIVATLVGVMFYCTFQPSIYACSTMWKFIPSFNTSAYVHSCTSLGKYITMPTNKLEHCVQSLLEM